MHICHCATLSAHERVSMVNDLTVIKMFHEQNGTVSWRCQHMILKSALPCAVDMIVSRVPICIGIIERVVTQLYSLTSR